MHPLIRLLATNKGRGFFRADTNTETDEATIYLYDAIVSDDYWGGVSPMQFATTLAAITSSTIHLRINSPGGDVFAARAIVQAMKECPANIIAHIDGVAASAATMIAIAADQSVIAEGGMFMIHNAWTVAAGNANDFAALATLLGRVDQTLNNDYVAKTGQTADQVKTWMDEETYFFGQEAVDAGFVNSVAEAAPKNSIKWDLSAYSKAPTPKNLNTQPKGEENADTSLPEQGDKPAQETKPDLSALYRRLALVERSAA